MRRPGAVALAAIALTVAACSHDGAGPSPVTVAPPSTPGADTTVAVTTGAPVTGAPVTVPAPASLLPVAPLRCDGTPEELGRVTAPLREVSGITPSRAHPGTWWVHNDSGDAPRIFRIDERARVVEERRIDGVDALDWEDISSGSDGSVWVADTGDNFRFRSRVRLIGVRDDGTERAEPVTVDVRYPDGPQDVEAFAIEPATGAFFVFSKGDSSTVMVVPPGGGETVVVATLALATVTAAEFSPDGVTLAVQTLRRTHLWRRSTTAEPWAVVLGRPADCDLDAGDGEAVAFTLDGSALVTLAEGEGSPLLRTPIA